MLLRNFDITSGLLNGTRFVVRNMHENCLELEVITGKGKIVLLPRIDLMPSDISLPFTFKRRQFPVRIAFCMTINKAQGQTFEKVGLFLPTPVFSHGQLYVALSRVRAFEDIRVQIEPPGRRTINIVYKEVL